MAEVDTVVDADRHDSSPVGAQVFEALDELHQLLSAVAITTEGLHAAPRRS